MTVPVDLRPAHPAGPFTATSQVAIRALRKFARTPALWAMGIVQSGLFLFSFRYVFGGAVKVGGLPYVDFLAPGYIATIVLFAGGGVAVAVAEDKTEGFTSRLLSLPIPRIAIVAGRTLADLATNVWAIATTIACAFTFGFRLPGSLAQGLESLGLCLVYALAFTIVFVVIGLTAPNAQAAQGMSMIAFVLAFFSSTYVPVATMPGWLQAFARYQPVTPMVDAVRATLVGSGSDLGLALLWSAGFVVVFTPLAVALYRRA